jgi:hypothetical protein
MAFAAITLALKINFIVQLIILAVEVAQAIATFGATTAAANRSGVILHRRVKWKVRLHGELCRL